MANVVKLYYTQKVASPDVNIEWELLPNKLLILDNIENYLVNKSSLVNNNFQYVKNELEIGINVDLSQSYSQPLTNKAIQYVSIQNDGEQIHYYFVKKATWRSKSCVRLELVMDVLNTFKENRDYYFKENTKITREHKDRFLIKNKKRYLVIKFDDYNVITSDPPQTEVESRIMYGDEVIFTGILYSYIEEEGLYKGFIMIVPETDTRTDTEILSLFIGWEENDSFSLKDEDNFELEFYFDNVPFVDTNAPEITKNADIYRNIDRTPENIVPLLVCDNTTDENIQHHKSKLRGDWYLLYRNQNDPDESLLNPVECYLIPEESVEVNAGALQGGRITGNTLQSGKYYYLHLGDIANQISLSNGFSYPSTSGLVSVALVYKQDDGKLAVSLFGILNGEHILNMYTYYNIDYITLNYLPQYYYSTNTQFNLISDYYDNVWGQETEYWDSGEVNNFIDGIELLDRTDAKNIKLIKIPYCPYDFNVSGGKVDIVSTNWNYEDLEQADHSHIKILKLNDLNTKLRSTIEETTYNPFDYLYFNSLSNLDLSLTHLREEANYESKLYHSEFFTPTFYYDSFAFKFELEKCDLFTIFTNYTKTSVKNEIKFDMTKTINSKFMFTFSNYEVLNNVQNYSKCLPIARNNEEVLYNVPYINYIRTGYQYDVKNKNISNISNALGIGLSAGSMAISLALPSAPLKVAGVVASIVSMAMSVKNAVVSAIQSDNSLKQKITQYQNQVSNVAGSDDVDLMSIYAENRLKYLEYEPRREMEELIFDLFFYAGYRSERMGIPSHNNRVNFDYLECDASIEKITTIPSDCLDELINCFKNGVTYLHYVSDRLTNKYDFAQQYENWEKIFFE